MGVRYDQEERQLQLIRLGELLPSKITSVQNVAQLLLVPAPFHNTCLLAGIMLRLRNPARGSPRESFLSLSTPASLHGTI